MTTATAPHICHTACIDAIGHVCECECGGEHHGATVKAAGRAIYQRRKTAAGDHWSDLLPAVNDDIFA